MKKFLGVAAAALAAGMAFTLAGCGGCSGCNSKTSNNTLTVSNWYTGTGFKGIQPFFIAGDNPDYTKEIIKYDVNFDGSAAANNSYSVNYKDGLFTTEFYAARYNWNSANIPENYRTDKTELLYCYKTELTISVQYKKGEELSEWFNDSVKTVCMFRAAEFGLKPVYSKQIVKSTSPNGYQASKLQSCYKVIDETYESFYDINCREVTTFNGENKTVYEGINKHRNSVFDNSSLYIAVRSMKLSGNFAQTVDLYSPAAGGFSKYRIAGNESGLADEERKAISTALADKGLYAFKNEEDKGVNTISANVSFADGELSGTTHKIWYAAVENTNNNTARATMLKLTVPISYNLGSLNYTLKEVVSTIWDK